jgi:hypothetical protein
MALSLVGSEIPSPGWERARVRGIKWSIPYGQIEQRKKQEKKSSRQQKTEKDNEQNERNYKHSPSIE